MLKPFIFACMFSILSGSKRKMHKFGSTSDYCYLQNRSVGGKFVD